ncbi:hypothetical protein GCM10019059_35510 [Camelimonas fluminis]|nr:hypothetical protein GCM10019059_35510 [Camelimonas fluminis]
MLAAYEKMGASIVGLLSGAAAWLMVFILLRFALWGFQCLNANFMGFRRVWSLDLMALINPDFSQII